ncbi:DNA polymerase [Methylobacterium sp. Leaf102]|uniref:error-prone DNA polymerase n=1 Tax=Methylobacterium sp. Leaf102 TaxID=1736253 RepID=UPI0006FEAE5E|nr:error-prone DNA polymerase [Methylobacterium sp. Leaf102]KQP21824.1 DNA polymerase [Methylobacterium sp. Leaf102]
MSYAELQVTTHFSFLRGASSPEELFAAAALLGMPALGITDRGSLAGVVRAHAAARTTSTRMVVGCRLDPEDGPPLLIYPTDRTAYARLCRLLTIGKRAGGKGACRLVLEDIFAWSGGLVAIALIDAPDPASVAPDLKRLRAVFDDRLYCALTRRFAQNDHLRLDRIAEIARAANIPTVATGDVLYHVESRRLLQDVVTCIREGCTIDAAGLRLEQHADRHLKPPAETLRLFTRHPGAVARTLEIVGRCRFSLDELTYQYPDEREDPSRTAQETLEDLTWTGARSRYADGIPDRVALQLRHELTLIERFAYAPYFLTVNAIVRFARSRGILCQGRGSAANSAVCFVLGITSIDPVRQGLLFERFISEERREPPDIDVDFEHERREEVIQWVYETYGRDRAALCATVIRYRARGAVREVGKVLGIPEDVTGALTGLVWGWSQDGVTDEQAAALNLNLADRRLRMTLDLARDLMGTPRHLSQHPGGFVLTQNRLDELVPIEPASMADRQVIEWDKDDVDALKFMKVDVLGLGMLGCMRRAFDLLAEHKDERHDLASIPAEDPVTYAMIRRADTVGVFQIESRAQMAMLPRMKPRTFYDLVIQVAIVRPGPIQGDMVHPYLRRREGREAVRYPTPELERVLGKTLGVPLFQEQAMQVAIVAAGFTPSEADQLRRAMATFKFTGGVNRFRDKLIGGMIDHGYAPEFAEHTFLQLEGFGSYGFPESHAASFALIAYASSWMKCRHPDVFCCAILNAQPMGFYAVAQLVRDARDHGVEIRPIDVNRSAWDCTLEPTRGAYFAVRLGFRMVRGLSNRDGARIVLARHHEPYATVDEVWRRAAVPTMALRRLAVADAFQPSLGLGRRDALWAIRALRDAPLPLFAAADAREGLLRAEFEETPVALTPMTAGREVAEDYRSTALSLRAHPLTFLRDDLGKRGHVRCGDLFRIRDGRRIAVAGLVLIRQKPGSAKGVMFITLEDETGIANLIVWPQVFERQRTLVLSSSLMSVRGRIQRQGQVLHVTAEQLTDLSPWLRRTGEIDIGQLPTGRGDEGRHGGSPDQRGREPTPVRGSPILEDRLTSPDEQEDRAPVIRVRSRNFR